MQRFPSKPRDNWQKIVEEQGFLFHSIDLEPYWDESAYYQFTAAEIDAFEAATYELDKMCVAAVQHVIDQNLFELFQIPQEFIPYVVRSWERDELTIYGRFDLAYDGKGPPKLLEYNADTPTALVEAAVAQWQWFKDLHGDADQFNSIHERLIEAWGRAREMFKGPMYFASMKDHLEDFITVNYLRDTAMQAGWETEHIEVENIGWNGARQQFLDTAERHMASVFKLYPWEWLIREEFGPHLLMDNTRWLEAPWKMVLSNKAILPVLHQLYPQSPYLLQAAFEPAFPSYVRKPLLAREGANVTIVQDGRTMLQTDGDYEGPFVYQELYPLPRFAGNYPVIGSWMVNGYACGIGIREDKTPATGNTSRFVPHIFRP